MRKENFMRKLSLILSLTVLLSINALAQEEKKQIPVVELYGGYSYAGGNFHGWNASITGNVNDWLGLTADISSHSGEFREGDFFREQQRASSYLFGPRFSIRKARRVTPFVHALFGASHLSTRETFFGQTTTASDTGFGMVLGGGLDVRLNDRVAIRAFQLDYLRTNFFGQGSNRGRLSFGIVFRFGKK
jgi:opacity protein-like surface antigen